MRQIQNKDVDLIHINSNVFTEIVKRVIVENKTLFFDKNYLRVKSNRNIDVVIADKTCIVNLNLNIQFGDNINQTVSILQKEIKTMIEHITDYEVKAVNIKLIDIA